MQIKVITDPDSQARQKIYDFQSRIFAFSKEYQSEIKDKYEKNPLVYLVAFEGEKIIGSINLFKRKIGFNKKTILLGGIGGVTTDPDFRRQGIATKLLKKGIEVFRQQNCDIAFLCTDINKLEKLYASVGFVPLGREYKATGLYGKIYFDEGGMIASVNSQEIFDEVLNDKEIFDIQGQDW